MIPGPASWAAARPVITKMPAPMMAPTPSDVSPMGPSARRNRFSPFISASNFSNDFRAKSCSQNMDYLMPKSIRRGRIRACQRPYRLGRLSRSARERASQPCRIRRLFAVEDQRDGAIVNQLDLHHRPETARGHRHPLSADGVAKRFVQRDRERRLGRLDETRPLPLAAVAVERELAHH